MSKENHNTDTPTIRLAQKGDTAAFGLLFRKHYDQMYRTIYGMMGNEADAKEVAQDTWVKVWQKIKTFNFTSNFTTWLHRIAVNTSLDELRRRKRYWTRFKSTFSPTIEEPASLTSNDSPARNLLKKENLDTVHSAIARLPEAQRTVLVLKEFEDYTYEQIANTLDCKIGTVMSRLHLARKKLSTYLNQTSQ